MTRWLAVDHGTKRIGLAVSDATGSIASPLEVLPAGDLNAFHRRLDSLLGEYDIGGVVVGWPLNMDDTEGPQGAEARSFAIELERRLDTDVRMWDERLSSSEADSQLAGHLTRNKRRARQDALAAATILQDFLANDGPDAAPRASDATAPRRK